MLAHRLGQAVVTELVESEPVAAMLRDLGIEYGQGCYWAAPAVAERPGAA